MSRNPFLVARFVLFAILMYLNVLILIFAALNVAAIKSIGIPAPGAAVFLIFNCCLLFLCLSLGLAQLVFTWTSSATVRLECVWTAILSILQLSATVTMNVNGPPIMCGNGGNSAACATSFVLVPMTWLSTFTIIAYCLTLTITTIIHSQACHDIWSASVYAVPWFVTYGTSPMTLVPSPAKELANDPSIISQDLSKSDDDIEAALPKTSEPSNITSDAISAPWAKNQGGRRGVDPPFATKDSSSSVPEARPRLPRPRVSRYFELSWFSRKSQVLATATPKTPGDAFSRTAGDENDPIPLPRLSEWIRADAKKGINVHTIPPVSP